MNNTVVKIEHSGPWLLKESSSVLRNAGYDEVTSVACVPAGGGIYTQNPRFAPNNKFMENKT